MSTNIRTLRPVLRIGQRTDPSREFSLAESEGKTKPIDLTNATRVTLTMEHYTRAFTAVSDGECEIVNPKQGVVEYDFSTAETSVFGRYYVQFEVTWDDNSTDLIPPSGYEWVLDIGRRQPDDSPLEVPRVYTDESVVGELEAEQAHLHALTGLGTPNEEIVTNLYGQNLYYENGRLNAFHPDDVGEVLDHLHTDTAGEGGPIGTATDPAAPAHFEAVTLTDPVDDTDAPETSTTKEYVDTGLGEKADAQGGTIGDVTPAEVIHVENLHSKDQEPDVIVRELDSGEYVANSSTGEIQRGTDGTAVLQAGVDACPDGGTVIAKGSYSPSSPIYIGGDKLVKGSATFDLNADTYAFTLADGIVDTTVTVAADVAPRQNRISVSDAAPFSPGDIAIIQRDEGFGDRGKKTEAHRVFEVDETNDILGFQEGVYFEYPTTDNAIVERIDAETGHLADVTIRSPDNTGSYMGVFVSYGADCTVKNVSFEDIGQRALRLQHSYGAVVRGNHFARCLMTGSGYGVDVRYASAETRIIDNKFDSCRHAVAHTPSPQGSSNGMPRSTFIIGNQAHGSHKSSTFDAHDGTVSWFLINNSFSGSENDGIITGAKDTYVIGNVYRGTDDDDAGNEGGFLRDRTPSMEDPQIVAKGNVLRHPGNIEPFRIYNAAQGWKLVDISDNDVLDPDSNSSVMRFDGTINNLVVENNTVDCEGPNGSTMTRRFIRGNTSLTVNSFSICGNTLRHLNHNPIELAGGTLSNGTIESNRLIECGWSDYRIAFELGDVNNCSLSNNYVYDPAGYFDTIVDVGVDSADNIITDNKFRTDAVPINDSGTGTFTGDNYVHDGSGWSLV